MPSTPTPALEIETARLRLRAWCEADRAAFAAMNADPEVMAHFPALQSRQQSDAAIDRWQAQLLTRGWSNWALERRDSSEFIGFVGLSVPARVLPIQPWPCVEIGWRLSRAHWGHGLASEAARAVLTLGFGRLALPELVSFTAAGNRRSRAVMERIGLQRDFAQDFDYPSIPEGHPLRPHVLYRAQASEWLSTHSTR